MKVSRGVKLPGYIWDDIIKLFGFGWILYNKVRNSAIIRMYTSGVESPLAKLLVRVLRYCNCTFKQLITRIIITTNMGGGDVSTKTTLNINMF